MTEAKKGFRLTAREVPEDEGQYVGHAAYEPLPGVLPAGDEGRAALAMDSTPYDILNQNAMLNGDYARFIGFPALATLAQSVEYYNLAQVMADEMVRNWICVKSEDKNSDRPDLIEKALAKYDIKRLFHEAVKQDSIFGVAHIYVDTGDTDIQNPLIMDPRSIRQGSKLKFKCVDPTWVYPSMYNAQDPLSDNFYKPSQWFVMGRVVHESRFIDIVSRPVPDILKPSYNFAGLSLTQLMVPYVDAWRDIKSDVAKIIKTLRLRILKTDMEQRQQDAGGFDTRMKMMIRHQDNFGILALDKEGEELDHIQTSLSDLSNLLSNYEAQLCTPARITNLKYLGSAPAGLNASGDSEMETWHETISGMQEHTYRHFIEQVIKIIQLVEFGDIDENIYFDFNPLDEVSNKEQAEIDDLKATSICKLSDSQIIDTQTAADAASKIEGLNISDAIAPEYEPEGESQWQSE